MEASPLELRPRNLLDLMDASVRLYRRHFGPLLGISALMLVPFGIVYSVGFFYYFMALGPMTQIGQVPPDAQIDMSALVIGLILLVLALVIIAALGPLSQGALALAISEQYLGRSVGVWEAYRRVVRYWWSLFWVGIVFGLLVSFGPLVGAMLGGGAGFVIGMAVLPQAPVAPAAIGAILGMLAGIPVSALLFTWFVFYEQTMVLENARGMDSLQRSRALVRGHGWHAFGTLFLTFLAITIATWVLTVPVSTVGGVVAVSRPEFFAHAQLLAQCVQQIVNILLGPLFMIVQTLTYYDLRIRKEGFDLQMMADAIEALRGRGRIASDEPAASDAPLS